MLLVPGSPAQILLVLIAPSFAWLTIYYWLEPRSIEVTWSFMPESNTNYFFLVEKITPKGMVMEGHEPIFKNLI